jgi:hypothetical protein
MYGSAQSPVDSVSTARLTTEARSLPHLAIGINLLYGAATFTPNLTLEVGVHPRSTIYISGSYNPWNRKGSEVNNKKWVHSIARAGYRYYFCERYNGHYVGINALFARYNVSGHKLLGAANPALRYDGTAWGGELNYGYHFMLSPHWNLELGVGAGVVHFNHRVYDCAKCGKQLDRRSTTRLLPTNAAISIIYILK